MKNKMIRIRLTEGYLIGMLLQGLLVERELGWWILQLGFLGLIHLVWWVVLIIKKKIKTSRMGLNN